MRKLSISNIAKICFAMMVCSATATPVPVDAVYCDPGFEGALAATNRQTLVYIAVGSNGYQVTGATCTSCPNGTRAGTTNDIPDWNIHALSGAVLTHCVLNISTGVTSGAKFDLGMTVINDNIGIVLGEIGTSSQTGDPISVYPLTNGVRVGTWVRRIEGSDYGKLANNQMRLYYNNYSTTQTLCPFMTVFRHGDFTNDTGSLAFDGIEINDTKDYDPCIVALVEETLPLYQSDVTNKLPVTAMTFSPGFDTDPELDGQTLTGLTTDEGTFNSLTGLTCTVVSGAQFVTATTGESPGLTATNALSGLKFTQMVANPDAVNDWDLGVSVTRNDANYRFFFGEMNVKGDLTHDPVTVYPLYNGEPVGVWKLEIVEGDYGTQSAPWNITQLSTDAVAAMVSFSLADFSSETSLPPLGQVNGFRVDCKNNADPNILGMYVVPAPSSLGTIILLN